MKWYVAELVVECRVGSEAPGLWDEQLVVLRADNAERAYADAIALGKAQVTTYRNSDGETVRWRFVGLANLNELLATRIRSGTEIHSRLSRERRPKLRRKRDLTVFWAQRNLHRTAGELLSNSARRFAPK